MAVLMGMHVYGEGVHVEHVRQLYGVNSGICFE